MATTMTIHQRAVRSTVAKKVIMAVTGLAMIAFLLAHMYGNLKALQGAEAFDGYAHWIKGEALYPILPKGGMVWVLRLGLLAAVVLHIWSAVALRTRTARVRGGKYQVTKRRVQTYSSRTMMWGGVIIAAFIVFHLLQFTVKALTIGFSASAGPYEMFVLTFQQWWMVLLYAVCMVLIAMHIRHGFWSAFATLGGNVSAGARTRLNWLSVFVAALLFIGFMIPPVAVLLGWVTL